MSGGRRALRAAAAAGALLLTPAGAAAALPHELTTDGLGRAALLALPSVHRLDVTARLSALVTRDGRRLELPEAARTLRLRGTAFAVAPGGYLVAAAHVAAPEDADLALRARQLALAAERRPHDEASVRRWVERTGARPAAGAEVRLRLTETAPDGGGAPARAGRLVLADRGRDLALLRIPAPAAPALLLDDATTRGTDVVALGFGGGGGDGRRPPLEPAIRPGRLDRTGFYPRGHLATVLTADIREGDSGGPVVDARGRTRGVVIRPHPSGGVMSDASELRQLLARAGVVNRAGSSADLFAAAMARLWALDLPGAQRGFAATLRAYPAHALAGRERRRAEALAAARFALQGADRRDGILRAVAALSGIVAAACGLLLLRGATRPGGRRGLRGPG